MPESGRYEKVLLTNLKVWEPSPSDDPCGVSLRDTFADPDVPDLRIRPIKHHPILLPRHHVIIQPDGSIWRDGSLYLYEKAVRGSKPSTLSNISGDLTYFINEMNNTGVDYLIFDGPQFKRPTYHFRNILKRKIANGELTRKTANRMISTVVGFFRYKCTKGFIPSQDMWISTTKLVTRLDRNGFQQVFEITCTDLTFPVPSNNNISCIEDGGKLFPIDRENQQHLIAALSNLNNPEMWLIHIIALTTGMRIQTILTLRKHSIHNIGNPETNDNDDATLFPISIGPGTLVDSKQGKPGDILMPGWVHRMLRTYYRSERAVYRRSKSTMKDDDNQYVFLSRGGKPYYVAEEDQQSLDSGEAGSAIRHFQKRIKEELIKIGKEFEYRFHDLRATFGMNLLEDNIMKNQKLAKELGIDSYIQLHELELIDLVRSRLNQSDITVAMSYLRYRRNHHLVGRAQTDFEAHLCELAQKHWRKHGSTYSNIGDS